MRDANSYARLIAIGFLWRAGTLSADQIAQALGCSRKTVYRQIGQIEEVTPIKRVESERPDDDALSVLWRSGALSIKQIAKILSCHPSSIYRRLKKTATSLSRDRVAAQYPDTWDKYSPKLKR